MTAFEALRLAQVVRDVARDDEKAHGLEDELATAILQSIADGTCDDPVGCAKAFLALADVDFARWCA